VAVCSRTFENEHWVILATRHTVLLGSRHQFPNQGDGMPPTNEVTDTI
jgi:hypothetical protein